MSIPVLIPARNEASHIAATLESLPAEAEPFVIPNDCGDDTAAIAERCGAIVLTGSEGGKLPALQFGIDHIGKRALEPLVALDADTRPLFPDKWLGAMLAARDKLDPQKPVMVTGSFVFEGLNPLTLAWLNTGLGLDRFLFSRHPTRAMSAANMLFDLQDETTVQQVMELPNVWPFEDKALRDLVLGREGQLANVIDRHARVATDAADNHRSLGEVLRLVFSTDPLPNEAAQYLAQAPPNSIPYSKFKAEREASMAA